MSFHLVHLLVLSTVFIPGSFSDHFSPKSDSILSSARVYTSDSSSDLLSDLTSSTQVSDFFYLYWTFNSNDTVTMALRWNTGGYFGLGFGTSMSGMDIITAEIVDDAIVVYDRYSTGETTPALDSDQGGTDDLTLLGYETSDSEGFAIAKFIRSLDTGDQYDYVISQLEQVSFCYAYADSETIAYHDTNKGVFTFDFVEGSNDVASVESGYDDVTNAHSYGNLAVWGFLAEISFILPRYFKHTKYGIDAHAYIFGIFILWTLIMALWMIIKNADDLASDFENSPTITAHFALGIIVVVFLLLQGSLGYILRKYPAIDLYFRGKIKRGHIYLGYFIYFITKITVLVGAWIFGDEDLFIGVACYFGVLFVARIIGEAIWRSRFGGDNGGKSELLAQVELGKS